MITLLALAVTTILSAVLAWVGRGAWTKGWYDEYAFCGLIGSVGLIFFLFCWFAVLDPSDARWLLIGY